MNIIIWEKNRVSSEYVPVHPRISSNRVFISSFVISFFRVHNAACLRALTDTFHFVLLCQFVPSSHTWVYHTHIMQGMLSN